MPGLIRSEPGADGALRTERLEGRPIRDADLPLTRALFGAPEVGFGTSADAAAWPEDRIAARTAAFAAHWRAHDFGLRLWFEQGVFVGIAGLHLRVVDGRGAVEASFALTPAAQGRGLAQEAMRAALAEAAPFCRVTYAVVYADNPRSARLLRRLGYLRAGAPALPDPDGGPARARLLFRRESPA